MKLIVFTDGASRGNPGPASYGYIIKDGNGLILHQEGRVIGRTTNNVAEYSGVLAALEYIKRNLAKNNPSEILFNMDSLLVVQQLKGAYKIKSPHLLTIYLQIRELEANLKISYKHVPREQNFLADRLANIALDQQRL